MFIPVPKNCNAPTLPELEQMKLAIQVNFQTLDAACKYITVLDDLMTAGRDPGLEYIRSVRSVLALESCRVLNTLAPQLVNAIDLTGLGYNG